MATQCPRCHRKGALRIGRGGVFEHLLSLCYIFPYRCPACSRRFRALRWGARYVKKQTTYRQGRRFETNFPVTFSCGDTHGQGIVTNIALDGCRLKTDLELTEDSFLQLKLQVPECEPEIRVETAVVRTVQTVFASLSFSRVAEDERTRLRQFLIRLMATRSTA